MQMCLVVLGSVVAVASCAGTAPRATAPAPRAPSGGPLLQVTGFTAGPHGVTLATTAGAVAITAVSDHVLRVRASREGTFSPDFSWTIVPGANAATGTVTVADQGASLLAATAQVRVRIEKSPLRISFLDTDGGVISEDARQRPMVLGPSGFRVDKAMPPDEHYYGLGDKAGPLDRRDMAFTNWNTDAWDWQESTDPLYKSIPFFIGLRAGRAYGLFLDDTWRSWFDFGKTSRDTYAFGADGGELDYYFIAGPHPKDVVRRYSDLTGRAPLPPLWWLGFQQCRYSYYPEARVYEIARTLRDKKIPADVIYLDIDYQKGYRAFTVDRERFPHFEKLVADLGQQGFKAIIITDLHIAKAPNQGYQPYDAGTAGDFFVHNPDGSVFVGDVWPGASVFPDFTWAPARAWWGTLYAGFVHTGVAGFWNDMNEPAVFNTPTKTMPLDVVHRVDSGGTATHGEVHNIFGMQNSRATYEGLLALQGNRRPVVLTRATFAGGQRYAASWTGDNTSTWNHYQMSIATLLNLGLSGYPLIGDDVGGFIGSPPPDLLTRWIELGAFNPLFRDHSAKGTLDQEPWVHGPQHEDIRRRYIETRYRLLPYIYALLEEASRTGAPLMRPFWLEHPEAEAFYTSKHMFLFGPDLLVQPKFDETLDPLEIVVPPGVWYDYWTGALLDGDPAKVTTRQVTVALGDLPVFVRGGAIVPHQPLVQSTSETPKGPLELRVYPGPDCHGSLYLDDGTSFDYRGGAFARVALSCQALSRSVSVKTGPTEGTYPPWFTSLAFVISGVPSRPREVTVAGRPIHDFTYDAAAKAVTVTAPYLKGGQTVTVHY